MKTLMDDVSCKVAELAPAPEFKDVGGSRPPNSSDMDRNCFAEVALPEVQLQDSHFMNAK